MDFKSKLEKIQGAAKDAFTNVLQKKRNPDAFVLSEPASETQFIQENYKNPTEKINELVTMSKLFTAIIESPHMFFLSMDVFANILDVSNSVLSILGFEREEVIGKNGYTFIHPEDHEFSKTMHHKALDEMQGQMIDLRFKTKSGKWMWFRVVGFILQEEEDIRIYTLGTQIEGFLSKRKEELKKETSERIIEEIKVALRNLEGSEDKLVGINSKLDRLLEETI